MRLFERGFLIVHDGMTLRQYLLGLSGKAAVAPDLGNVILDLLPAARMISYEVNRAGLIDITGHADSTNVHGEAVQKLDLYTNELVVDEMRGGGRIAGMVSEEVEELITVTPEAEHAADYVILFDPLDGSSNIDVNVSIGTIFSVFHRVSPNGPITLADFLQKGREQVAAGYFVYGSSTMLVLTVGDGVHGFTMDPSTGDFRLSHSNVRIPEFGSIYSCNEGNAEVWDEGTRAYIHGLKQKNSPQGKAYSARYVGSLVADFHRNLLKGGIFLYPADRRNPDMPPRGKLRLMYEANPMAFLAEQAGGLATDGTTPIMEVEPTDVHQKVALIVGSAGDVREFEGIYSAALAKSGAA
jgi:fructose-1,6-bisphosphatase I